MKLILIVLSLIITAVSADIDRGFAIINGHPATISEVPYQVSLRYAYHESIGLGYGFTCGGSLITEQIVLSAAHCVVKVAGAHEADKFVVVMGTVLLDTEVDTTQKRKVKKMKVHDDYNRRIYQNDIALMWVEKPFRMNAAISIISLVETKARSGANCKISGWGVSSLGKKENRLMATNVSIVETAACNSRNSYDGRILSGMLCAGSMKGDRDTCQGDSGGPLVCEQYLVGITSWGRGCAQRNYPGVYTDVYYYLDWIKEESEKLQQ